MANAEESNVVFLDAIADSQRLMSSDVIELAYARIVYNFTDLEPYWNYALTDDVLSQDQVSEIEKRMEILERKPSIYFENKPALDSLKKLLLRRGYTKSFEDSLMFYNENSVGNLAVSNIKKIESVDELSIWIKLLDDCFLKNDPQNPYGPLSKKLLKQLEDLWNDHHKSNKVEYFMAHKDSKPVAVATLNNESGFGYITGVGSLKEVRGQGFGKAITLYCVSKSMFNGNTAHFLATEEGQYPNEFYKRIGFKTRFKAVCYTNQK